MPQDEKRGQDVHYKGYLFPLAGKQFDEDKTQHAKGNAFRNAVCQGHHDHGKEDGQRFGIIIQIYFLYGTDHE